MSLTTSPSEPPEVSVGCPETVPPGWPQIADSIAGEICGYRCPQTDVFDSRIPPEMPRDLRNRFLVERVKAGLRNARAKGKRLGRPRKILDTKRIAARRVQGVGWKRIAAEMGVGVGTIYRVTLESSKTREKDSGTAAGL